MQKDSRSFPVAAGLGHPVTLVTCNPVAQGRESPVGEDVQTEEGDNRVFCGQCGRKLSDGVRYCESCGRPTAAVPTPTSFTDAAAAVAQASPSFPAPGAASYQHRWGHVRAFLCSVGVVIFGLVLLRVLVTVVGIVVGLALRASSITLEVMNHFVPILAGNSIVGVLCYVLAVKCWEAIRGPK